MAAFISFESAIRKTTVRRGGNCSAVVLVGVADGATEKAWIKEPGQEGLSYNKYPGSGPRWSY